MFKILRFRSGPYEEAGYVWCIAEVEDQDGIRDEEIFYDTMGDACGDLEDFYGAGFILHEDEEYLTLEEEMEVDHG